MTKNMWAEYRGLEENSRLILESERPNIPFYAFISGEADEKWQDILKDYADQSFVLDAGHYIHLYKPEYIAEKMSTLTG